METLNHISIIRGNHVLYDNQNICLKSGLLTAVVGQSGSGKTTLLNYIHENLEQVFYIKQSNNLFPDITCLENFSLITEMYGKHYSIEEIIDEYNILNLPVDFNRYPNELSGGERQLISLFLAYLVEKKITILDEITASVDDEGKALVFSLLKRMANEKGITLMLATHDESLIKICDVVYQIQDNQLVLIRDAEELSDSKTLNENYFGKYKKLYHKYKFKKNKGTYLLEALALGIMIAGISVGLVFNHHIQRETKQMISNIPSNQALIFHSELNGVFYDPKGTLFTDEDVSSIKTMDVDAMYPFVQLPFHIEKDSLLEIDVLENENNVTHVFGDEVGKWMFGAAYPYYEQQKFESLAIYLYEQVHIDGIPCFITQDLANELNIGLKENCAYDIELDVDIPFGEVNETLSLVSKGGYEDDMIEVGAVDISYAKTKLKFNVKGVINTRSGNYLNSTEIYIPYDSFVELIDANHPLIYPGNAYMFFGKHLNNVESILTSLIPNVGFTASQTSYQALLSEVQAPYINLMSKMVKMITLIVLLILIGIGVLYERSIKIEREIFKTANISMRSLIIGRFIQSSLFTFIIFLISSPLILHYFKNYGYFNVLLLTDYTMLILYGMILSIVGNICAYTASLVIK